jgi:hypothetical protein
MNTETKLGHALRESALDAHGTLPHITTAYAFLLHNPQCFEAFAGIGMDGEPIWPASTPAEPSVELIAAYYFGDFDLDVTDVDLDSIPEEYREEVQRVITQ